MPRTFHEHLVNSNEFVKEITPLARAKNPLRTKKYILLSTLHMQIQCVTFFSVCTNVTVARRTNNVVKAVSLLSCESPSQTFGVTNTYLSSRDLYANTF
jgi:hypothetical protein